MHAKYALPLIFVLSALFAASATVNAIALFSKESPQLSQDRTNTYAAVTSFRQVGTLLENNAQDRTITISYEDRFSQNFKFKIWLTSNARMQHIDFSSDSTGLVSSMQLETIDQTSLKIGEPIYVVFTYSPERKRYETSSLFAGSILPFAQ